MVVVSANEHAEQILFLLPVAVHVAAFVVVQFPQSCPSAAIVLESFLPHVEHDLCCVPVVVHVAAFVVLYAL